MNIKAYIALSPLVAIAIAGFVASLANAEAGPGVSLTSIENADLEIGNQCSSPFNADYMELLENSDESVLFVGCGGLL